MFPTLTPSIPPPTVSKVAPGGEAAGPDGKTGTEASAGSDTPGAVRGTESKSFSAVLLALASIGSPLHAAAPPATAAAPPKSAFFETAFAVDHEVLAASVELDDGTRDDALLVNLAGAHGVAPAPGKSSTGDEWMAFKVLDGHVVFGGAVDMSFLEGLGALRPFEAGGLGDPSAPSAEVGDAPAVIESWEAKSLETALGASESGAASAALSESVASVPMESAPLQVAVQVGPPLGSQEVQESPPLDPSMLNRLSGEFVTRLERVADRMFTEYGLEIDVVEGFRSQGRQEALFAQGRTAPGNVVTWTTNSLHTVGAAADVFVDGAPVTPEQAAILARVAAQEGLKTLYPYDSGHIQLDRGGAASAAGPEGPLDRQGPANAGGAGATPAPGVAQPAPVARVARPARPGGMAFGLMPGAVEAEHAPDANTLPRQSDAGRPGTAGEALPVPSEGVAAPSSEPKASPVANTTSAPLVSASLPDAAPVLTAARGSPVTPVTPVDLSAFDAIGGGSEYRRLHLPIEGVAGSASLDIGVRPGSVDALLNVSDPQLADELRRSLHELRQVLTERGIEARGLGVRLVADSGAEPVQAALDGVSRGGSSEGTSGQSTTQGGRDRGARYRDSADQQDLPQQSRREHSDKENS